MNTSFIITLWSSANFLARGLAKRRSSVGEAAVALVTFGSDEIAGSSTFSSLGGAESEGPLAAGASPDFEGS